MQELSWSPLEREIIHDAEGLIQVVPSAEQAFGQVADLLTARVRHFSWVGFYLLKNGHLELVAHSGRDHPPHPPTVSTNRGPRGLAAASATTVILPSLRRDPRWLACPVTVLAEIVVPIKDETTVYGEIDVDAKKCNGFDLADRRLLEALADRLLPLVRPRWSS